MLQSNGSCVWWSCSKERYIVRLLHPSFTQHKIRATPAQITWSSMLSVWLSFKKKKRKTQTAFAADRLEFECCEWSARNTSWCDFRYVALKYGQRDVNLISQYWVLKSRCCWIQTTRSFGSNTPFKWLRSKLQSAFQSGYIRAITR